MIEILGYTAMILSWLGLYLCRKYRLGWTISTLVWFLWFPYAILISSIPVAINTTVYAAISFWNWKNWRKDHADIQ